MRNAFASEMVNLALKEPRLVLLMGDIGNKLFDPFKAKFPDRFFNCGVAEANMVSMAAGMAMSGLLPVCYTITPFITSRCYEQIRVDLCYQNLPVILVGVGAGLSYASLGATHHACEDIAILRVLPHMTVICPGDAVEVRLALSAAVGSPGPVYVRLGKKGEPVVHQAPPPFSIGKAIMLQEGKDLCILSTGNLLPTAMETAKLLGKKGISARVVSFHTVKPLDEQMLLDAFSKFPIVATLEEHGILGGFGGSVAEWKTDHSEIKGILRRFGTPDSFFHEAGEQEYARERLGLSPKSIADNLAARLVKNFA